MIDQALCEQSGLRILRDALARKWEIWQRHCGGSAAHLEIVPHTLWLVDVRMEFDRLKDVPARDFLGNAFTRRADELAWAISVCGRESSRKAVEAQIDTIRLPPKGQSEAVNLPFVRTTPALPGMRINDVLYRALAGMEAPDSPSDEDVRAALLKPPSSDDTLDETMQVSMLWRDPRLLMLQADYSGCALRCWKISQWHMFDLRTGDRVKPDDLFTRDGIAALDRFGKRGIARAADEMRRAADEMRRMTPDDLLDAFDDCFERGWRPAGIGQIVWLKGKRWQVKGPACSVDGEALPSPINSQSFPLKALAPYLSAYGKSLLLGDGDVRMPEPPMQACDASGAPPDPQDWAARVAEISAGERHVLLREASGRVWGWGMNHDRVLGTGCIGCGERVTPFVLGDDYLYAGAGNGFSIGLRRDGSLWTWGTGKDGPSVGSSAQSREPVRIGDNAFALRVGEEKFVLADTDNSIGYALAQDGRLWVWNSSFRHMRTMADEVAQVSGNIPVLVLQRDGSLRAWNEWHWIRPGESKATPDDLHWHGAGFERLPRSRHVEAAWRADGTAWAWGQTLAAMTIPEALPGLEENPWPRLIGRDWKDIKASYQSTLVAALKSDGSLWVSQEHGGIRRMDRLGCGFADMAFANEDAHGVHLLALRSDGTLLDYHSDANRYDAPRKLLQELLDYKPDVLASGVVKLFQGNDYWGNVGARIFLLNRDGTLWEWNRGQIKFPKEWFDKDAPKPCLPCISGPADAIGRQGWDVRPDVVAR